MRASSVFLRVGISSFGYVFVWVFLRVGISSCGYIIAGISSGYSCE